jgi:hypothetical protein
MTSKAGNVSWTDQTDEVPSSSKEEEHKKDKGYKILDEVSLAELSTAVGSDLKTLQDDDSDMETQFGLAQARADLARARADLAQARADLAQAQTDLDTRSVGSKSRISSARGPKTSKKDQDTMVAPMAKQGITWTPKVDEASSNSTKRQTELWTTPENRRAGLVAATGLHTAKGPVSQHVYAEHLASINSQGRLEREVEELTRPEKCEDVVQFRGKMESSFRPSGLRYLEWDPVQNQYECTLCSKFADKAHLTSLRHLKNLEEAAMGNIMLTGGNYHNTNPERSKKPHVRHVTVRQTNSNLLKFWPDELPNVAQLVEAEQMFKQKGKIYIDNKEKNFLEPTDVLGCRLVFWLEDDKIDIKGNTMMGWWPAHVYDMSQETTRQPTPHIVKPRAMIVLVTCFYQNMEGRIVGWWIFWE